jgi:hypothetical protein
MRALLRGVAALALAAAVSGCSAGAASAAELALSASAGPPGTKLTATGTGFTPGAAVTVSFDATALKSATVGAAGTFKAAVAVPGGASPGAHTFTATDSSAVSASAAFTVRADWSSAGFDAGNSRFNPFEDVLTREAGARPRASSTPRPARPAM